MLINFMDGINGITGGYSLIILGTLAFINHSVVSFVDRIYLYNAVCCAGFQFL